MSAPAASTHPNAVTVLVTRRARVEHEAAFVRANEGMTAAARAFAGHLRGYMVHPVDQEGPDARLYHVVFAFDTQAHLRQWQDSAERTRWLAEMAPHTETESGHRLIPGLEHWFALPGRQPPPRWKVALVTWLGICPTVWTAQTFVGPLMAEWASFPRVAVLTALLVVAMTWVIAPLLTQIFTRWLYPSASLKHP
jgi:antibiotic biosynthesis monooxygenase (ABM) superfamily enzyme